ncbi:hypothetical protein K7432_018175 [Basidiobolus ranarum]|uniref:Uncharacterized protein n=1 Tax=Basidiobolus ranarum TaxID=34480 RepID=A0ABR2VJC3_9FUNG
MLFHSRAILLFSTIALLTGTSAAPTFYKSKTGDGYCRGIVAKLNLLGANIDAKVCIGNGGNDGGGKNPGGMGCPELVASAKALGINVDAKICLGGGGGTGGGNNGGGNGGNNGGGNGGIRVDRPSFNES